MLLLYCTLRFWLIYGMRDVGGLRLAAGLLVSCVRGVD
jgi:hypothetical protein